GVRVPDPAHRAAVLHQEEGLGQRPLITSSARISEKPLRGLFCWAMSFRGDAKHRTRNLEIPGLLLRTIPYGRCPRLLPERTADKMPVNHPEISAEEPMGTSITFKRPDGKDAAGYLANAARGNAPGVVVI